MKTIMIRNDEINFEKVYENVKFIKPFCENGIVYGELNFEMEKQQHLIWMNLISLI